MVLSELLFSSTRGPPISANTAVARDVGVHGHALSPSWAVKATFKKSSAPPRCLAVSDSHVFAAQDQKAHVHVYSRLRGNQEALVPFQERIRCLALAGDVLILGTAEGRLILWEVRRLAFAFSPSSLQNRRAKRRRLAPADRPLRLPAMCRPLAAWPLPPSICFRLLTTPTSTSGPWRACSSSALT